MTLHPPWLSDVLKNGRRLEKYLNRRNVVLVSVVHFCHLVVLEDDVLGKASEVRLDVFDEVRDRTFQACVFVENLLAPDFRFWQF